MRAGMGSLFGPDGSAPSPPGRPAVAARTLGSALPAVGASLGATSGWAWTAAETDAAPDLVACFGDPRTDDEAAIEALSARHDGSPCARVLDGRPEGGRLVGVRICGRNGRPLGWLGFEVEGETGPAERSALTALAQIGRAHV